MTEAKIILYLEISKDPRPTVPARIAMYPSFPDVRLKRRKYIKTCNAT